MPPKRNNNKMSAKAEQKLKNKIVEDKTFGLKNKKKSSKVAKYVQQVQQQVNQAGNRKMQKEQEEKKKILEQKKKEEAKRKAELSEIFKPVQIQQKVPFGVDPKTILCAYFKSGTCQKGTRCKFSHDLNIERKAEKIDLYTDYRGKGKGNKNKKEEDDTMESWDQSKLESVIDKKFGKDNSQKPTEIVCKYFLEAIETRKYGFFWECPNGGNKCKYRHALPPGFVLKKKETEEEKRAREEREKENQISIEEFLETERHKLGPNLTPITYESFNKWKSERKLKKEKENDEKAKAKADAYKQFKAGMKSGMGAFSGRELFDFNPDWAQPIIDEEDAMESYEREDNDDNDVSSTNNNTDNINTNTNTNNNSEEPSEGNFSMDKMSDSIAKIEEDVKVNEELFAEEDLEGLDDIDDDDDDE